MGNKCLKLLEGNLNTDEAEPVLYAELCDRLSRNTNQKKKYGMPIIEEDGIKRSHLIEQDSEIKEGSLPVGNLLAFMPVRTLLRTINK